MNLNGTVKDIIYRNSENGYTIISVSVEFANIVATGKFPAVNVGEYVKLQGEYVNNPKYGMQFVASKVEVSQPVGLDGIIKYLSSGLIPGVGAVTATNIVNMFKERTLEVIEKSPSELVKVRGVSETKAKDIASTYAAIKKMQEAVMFLQQYDISTNMAVKIYNAYKDKTKKVLSENPYRLIEDIDGIGFKSADKIAFNMGIAKDSAFRIRAGIIYCLTELAETQGSTVIERDKLTEIATGILDLPAEYEGEIQSMITNLEIEGIIKSTTIDDESAVAITKFYTMERFIADKLKVLISSASELDIDITENLQEYERVNNLKLHKNQISAITKAVKEGVIVITGGPGTGKTTIIKAILDIFKAQKMKTTLLAPTGRAAKRMEEQTGRHASTIHRGLEMAYVGGHLSFTRNQDNPLDTDVVIVDEVSMIDIFVASALLKAIRPGTRLILVGDKDQLMSVGAGNVLSDIIESGEIPVVSLSQIYRQADTSKIVINAHLINNSEMPDLKEKSEDFFHSSTFMPEMVANEIVDMVGRRIPGYKKEITPEDIQVIAPAKSGPAGTNNLNVLLRDRLNPASADKKEFQTQTAFYREGDKVMQISNNYELEWVKKEDGRLVAGQGVFNGDMGYIDQINPDNGEVFVTFEDGRRAGYTLVELEDLVHSYAITVHKSQGSEFKVVIIPIVSGNPMLYTKNLLYTAVTRAKMMVVLIGKSGNIFHMVKNQSVATRNTLLKKFLMENTYNLS